MAQVDYGYGDASPGTFDLTKTREMAKCRLAAVTVCNILSLTLSRFEQSMDMAMLPPIMVIQHNM